MNVIVTGAAGFLGSHLMLYHLKRGDHVLGLDNFCSSRRKSLQTDLIDVYSYTGRLLECDIASHEQVRSCVVRLDVSSFDVIYNFACPASPPRYMSMPVETMMTCVAGTLNVLELAREFKCRVVHASTSEVYGDPHVSPQTESYRGHVNSYGPRACYDEGKRAAEALCFDYLNKFKTDVRLVRIFNTYGPHMDSGDGRVISNFVCQGIKGEPLTVAGNGSQTRSFCYVDDLIRGIVALGEVAENPRTPVNLGNPNEMTVMCLAHEVSRRFGSDIVHVPAAIDDPTQRKPDIALARELLGWEPLVDLARGLDETIEYFNSVLTRDDGEERSSLTWRSSGGSSNVRTT